MSEYTLIRTRFAEGMWEGIVAARTGGAPPPGIVVTVLDRTIEAALCPADTPDAWQLRIPVPPDVIGEGAQTFLIRDARDDEVLARFSIAGGDILGDGIAAELSLLRAELDMLKRAFRRHCRETS